MTEPPSAAVQGEQETGAGSTASLAEDQTGALAHHQSNPNQKKKQSIAYASHTSSAIRSEICSCLPATILAGCKAGTQCPFMHTQASQPTASEIQPRVSKPKARVDDHETSTLQRQYEPRVDRSKLVSRPVPKTEREDPRVFQLGQLRRRFAPTEESVQDATLLKLKLAPSDPDFPFDLPFLECSLTVPLSYPEGKPKLRITNSEMPRGFQLNVERGFDQIIIHSPDATLLGVFNRLDKQLETLLSGEKADTVKIIRNAPKIESEAQPPPVAQKSRPQQAKATRRAEPAQIYTTEQKLQAEKKRQADIRQLVARLGRLPGFVRSSDDISFTIPFQPTKKTALPGALQNQKSIRLVVPQLYNLHAPRIEVFGNYDPSARAFEQAFQDRVKAESESSLIAHINYLTQHAHTMSLVKEPTPMPEVQEQPQEVIKAEIVVPKPSQTSGTFASEDSDKSHIHVIPRPPEWNNGGPDDWSSDGSDSYDSGDETEEVEVPDQPEQPTATNSGLAERGIMLSFPNLELYGCELLELVSLSITVKCERCKDLLDVPRLRNNVNADVAGMRDEICKKCANSLAIGIRYYYYTPLTED
ncbi:hypothetical protein E4T39_05243 [Aureobasidium subglaciale]|nr:hypothetical protein E4T39_05243 [Aureobasidium subglaciale]